MALLEPQIFVAVEQFGAENISLLGGRLVIKFNNNDYHFQLNFRTWVEKVIIITLNKLICWKIYVSIYKKQLAKTLLNSRK